MMIVADHGTDHDDHDRLDDGGQRGDRGVHLLLVEVGDLPEHCVELAGLLADLDHLADHRREDRVLHQGLRDRDARVHLLPDSAQRLLDDPVACGRTVISSALRMSTPAATSVESVRANRAIATLSTMSPIFIGTRSLKASHTLRPPSLRFQRRKQKIVIPIAGKTRYHRVRMSSERLTISWVSVGSVPLSCPTASGRSER